MTVAKLLELLRAGGRADFRRLLRVGLALCKDVELGCKRARGVVDEKSIEKAATERSRKLTKIAALPRKQLVQAYACAWRLSISVYSRAPVWARACARERRTFGLLRAGLHVRVALYPNRAIVLRHAALGEIRKATGTRRRCIALSAALWPFVSNVNRSLVLG
eukprot:6181442-Pleurochrysis_carterae.AAC.2